MLHAINSALRLRGGTHSAGSLTQFEAALERLAVHFEELARGDARLPLANRDGCSAAVWTMPQRCTWGWLS